MHYESSRLTNGVTVVTEHMDGVSSVTLGLWVRSGSREETPETAGISHFMEHMLFKGTPTRDAFQIALEGDSIGADMNAFTSRECTCFHARVTDAHFAEAFEILADMLVNAKFDDADMDLEREVVLEEIARSADTPEDSVGDLFFDALLPTHPLGRPVLGDSEVVSALTGDDMRAWHASHCTTGNVWVCAAGAIDHETVVSLAERHLSGLCEGPVLERPHPEIGEGERLAVQCRDTEQAHLVIGMPSVSRDDPMRWAMGLYATIMGGSMSSRLFAEVREKRGLAYSIAAGLQTYEDTGAFAVAAGTRPENLAEVMRIIDSELERAAEEGVSREELERARDNLSSHCVMGLESTYTRMMRLGRPSVSGMPILSTEETLAKFAEVSTDDIARAAAQLSRGKHSVAVISPWRPEEVEEMLP